MRSILRNAIHRIEGIVYHPDPAMLWIRPATEAAVQLCAHSGAEVIWATGGPWSSFVVARDVSRRTGRPYVLDLRDSCGVHFSSAMVSRRYSRNGRERVTVSCLAACSAELGQLYLDTGRKPNHIGVPILGRLKLNAFT